MTFEFSLRFLAGSLGVLMVSLAFLLYENEEGKVTSRLEDWWVRVDDMQRLAIDRQSAFLAEVIRVLSTALDKVLGERLVSWKVLTISSSFALASYHSFYSLLLQGGSQERVGTGNGLPLILWLAALSTIWRTRIFGWSVVAYWLLNVLGIWSLFTTVSYYSVDGFFALYHFVHLTATLTVGGLLIMLLVGGGRWFLRRWPIKSSIGSRAAVMLAGILSSVVVILFPLLVYSPTAFQTVFQDRLEKPDLWVSFIVQNVVLFLAYITWVAAMPGVGLLGLALLFLLHRASWLLVNRTLYALARRGFEGLRNGLVVTGVALCTLALLPVGSWSRILLKRLALD